MAIKLQTLLNHAKENMGSGMNPVVNETILEVVKLAYEAGIFVQITAGYRSFREQNELYERGRTNKSKPIVTYARGGQSLHNYGLAVDFVIVSDDGKRALWTEGEKWTRVAAIAKSLGFVWGGDFELFRDFPHLGMSAGLSTRDLQKGWRPNLVSRVASAISENEAERENG
ncbi:M15 family metallopeptidase [Peribacillus simplex]|uniref:M15 family metallopeptidase n=1 Tax=Peribacillus TaxID=2675229 RepID=UPI0021630641|nr:MULTISPECIES: M15 family metallopeptidase [Peribacillus]MBX9954510.1 M15 family metallopeptidase [Peribacillus simplex]